MTGILAIGAGQVASTAWHILHAIATVIGFAWLALVAIILLIWTVDAIRKPKTLDQLLDDLVADIGICPWCKVRECTDPRLCTCDEPCGMALCMAVKEVTP